MEGFVDDDDCFGDLYSDVEVLASSAINTAEGYVQFHSKNDSTHCNAIGNSDHDHSDEKINSEDSKLGSAAAKVEAVADLEDEEGWRSSESEDDLNILLNDEVEINSKVDNVNNNNFNNGLVFDDMANEEGHGRCDNGEDLALGGAEGGKKGKSDAVGCNSKCKNMKFHSPAFPSNLKGNGSAGIASYCSMSVRGDWDERGYIHRRGSSSLASQNGHNFSLPRSMTILDVNIDIFEQKRWRHPSADVTDFFNFGLNEDSWKKYCNSLDEYRAQTIKASWRPSTNCSKHYTECGVGSGNEVIHRPVAEEIANSMQQKPELISGSAIHVQHCIFERQPSTDVRCPLDRDPNVIIQIAVQDTEEDSLISAKEVINHTGSTQKTADKEIDSGVDEGRDIPWSSSASEEEKLSLEEEGDGSGNSLLKRCTPASGPLSGDSDNYGSAHISNSGGSCEQDWTDLDGSVEAMEASDDTGESVGRKIFNASPSLVEPESSNGRQHLHRPVSPISGRSRERPRNGFYADVRETYRQSKVASAGSELRESVTYDSSNHLKNHGFKTESISHKIDARSRSPMRDGHYYRKRHIHKSEFKNHMDDDDASYFKNTDGFYKTGGSTVNHKRRRNEWHGFDSYGKQDNSYHEEPEHLFDCGDQELSNHNFRDDYAESQNWKGFSNFGFGMDQIDRQNVNGKQNHFKRRTSGVGHKLAREDFYHHRRIPAVHGLESVTYEESRWWTLESDCYIENIGGSRWKTRTEDFPYLKRNKNEGFLLESHMTRNLLPKHHREPALNNDRNILEHRYNNRLLYDRREFESPRGRRWRCESPLNSFDNSWCEDLEDEKRRCNSWYEDLEDEIGRCDSHPGLSPGSFDRPLLVNRHKWPGAVSPKRGKSHFRNWRSSTWTKRSNNKDWLATFDDSVDTDETMMNIGDQDDHVRKVRHGQCEISYKDVEQYNSIHWDDEFYGEGPSYSSERVYEHRRFDAQRGSCRGRDLIDTQLERWGRSNLKTVRHSGSQNLQNSNFIRGHNHVLTLPRFRDSIGSHLVGVNGKRNLQPAGRSFNHPKWIFPENVAQGENSKVATKQKGEHWHHKFSGDRHNDSQDIEEGQIITEAMNEKAMQKASSSEVTRQIGDKKKNPDGNSASERDENRRILEIIEKMEKRRERFKQPITMTNDVEKISEKLADTAAEIRHPKPERPARKRKWH